MNSTVTASAPIADGKSACRVMLGWPTPWPGVGHGTVQPGLEPHRKDVVKTQGVPSKNQSPHRRRFTGSHPRSPRRRHPSRRYPLVHLMRLHRIVNRSRPRPVDHAKTYEPIGTTTPPARALGFCRTGMPPLNDCELFLLLHINLNTVDLLFFRISPSRTVTRSMNGYVPATLKNILANLPDTSRKGDADQRCTAFKRPIANALGSLRDRDIGQGYATRKGKATNTFDALRDVDMGQRYATIKSPVANVRDTRRDRDTD